MRYNMLVVLQGIIIYWIFLLLPRFWFLWAEGMARRPTKLFFQFSLLASCFFASLLWWYHFSINTQSSWRYLKIWVSFWPILKLNTTACPIVRISGVIICVPSRITFIKFLVLPQLRFIRRHAVHWLKSSLVDPLFRELTFYTSS